ncbi:MAG: hypothetical protein OEY24_04620 [Candidatus Bathyarchaeota archaeon]|nr:hypothetical protein [Candidatus Bathyarchaeota archaeon]MDH5494964.1 hypothetical protein [Candidatus Bathyarchaeota archaeon]
MIENEKERKKGLEIIEWVKLIGYVASILVASTTLLSLSGYVPSWWFHFALIFLIGLIFSIPFVVFYKPISKSIEKSRLKRKQNAIARKHFAEFKDLVDIARRFASPIRTIQDSLRTHYEDKIQSSLAMHVLQSHVELEIRRKFFEIEERLNESNKTFRDLRLIMEQFELCLDIYKRHLKIIEEFAHEMITYSGKRIAIAKGIEDEFEAFREKFNDFVKDFQDYCRNVNKELGKREFPEWAIHRIKKW